MKHFEDFKVGETDEFGHYKVTREEVIDFASKYDPQPFHLNDEAAAQTYFGKISASGWHTCGMTMRMMVDRGKENPVAGEGSPGVDQVRWKIPVYPGDTLRVRSEVIAARPLKSRPTHGVVTTRHETVNQNGDVVMTFEGAVLIRRRAPSQD